MYGCPSKNLAVLGQRPLIFHSCWYHKPIICSFQYGACDMLIKLTSCLWMWCLLRSSFHQWTYSCVMKNISVYWSLILTLCMSSIFSDDMKDRSIIMLRQIISIRRVIPCHVDFTLGYLDFLKSQHWDGASAWNHSLLNVRIPFPAYSIADRMPPGLQQR